jgi:hypothetical protein
VNRKKPLRVRSRSSLEPGQTWASLRFLLRAAFVVAVVALLPIELDALLVLFALLVFELARWLSRTTALDEGGLRIDWLGGLFRRYVPYSSIARVFVAERIRIVAEGHDGRQLDAWSLPDERVRAQFYGELADRVEAARSSDRSGLGREGRSLTQWVSDLRSRFTPRASAYRAGRRELREARDLIADVCAPLDARAGAAFALLASRDPEAAERVERSIHAQAPPLVIALAALAADGAEYVAEARRVLRYLDAADRAGWRRAWAEAAERTTSVVPTEGSAGPAEADPIA